MRLRLWALGFGLWAAALGPLEARRSASALRCTFHHIHVNDTAPGYLLAYYGKLFDRATTTVTSIGEEGGIEASGIFLLITPARGAPPEKGSAGWHFGWGTVALDEPYDRHRMQEIEWTLPLESFAKGLHLHLESADPMAAAAWYRDVLGARIETAAAHAAIAPIKEIHRRPVAIARFDGVALAIYKAGGPLEASRGHRIDHIAFRSDLRAARGAGLAVLERSGRLGPFETMIIEGPDRLAIELVGAPALKP